MNNARKLTVVLTALLIIGTPALARSAETVKILPPDAKFHGKTYPQWAAAFWQWMLGLPLEGHPALDDPAFDFSAGQSGSVWHCSAPEGTHTRAVTIPAGKALFITIRGVDTSTLEEPPFFGATEAEQRANSKWFADHIVNVFCVIDGVPVENLQAFRFSSPLFEFTAPTPWIFGATGGTGTAVGDGYYLMLSSLPEGTHTIRYGGTFHFDAGELADVPLDFPKDMTLQLTVSSEDDDQQ